MTDIQKQILREYLSEGRVSKESFTLFNKFLTFTEYFEVDNIIADKAIRRFYEFSVPKFILEILWLRTDRTETQYETFKRQFYSLEKAVNKRIETWEDLVGIIKYQYFENPYGKDEVEYQEYSRLTKQEKEKFWALLRIFFDKLVGEEEI